MLTVYLTVPREAASELARFLVEERLAACVNAVECVSTYRWEGTVYDGEEETILFAKTTAEGYEELRARVEEEHPYEVPCVERFDPADVTRPYAEWIDDEVR